MNTREEKTVSDNRKDYGKLIKALQITTGIVMAGLVVLGIVIMKKYNINAKNIPQLSAVLEEHFGNGVLILSLVMIGISVLKSFALILPPAVAFSVTAYVLPNPVIAFFVNMAAMILSLAVPYFLGKFTGKDMVDTLTGKFKAIKKIDDFAGTNEFQLTAVVKFAGLLPGDLSSLLFGAMNISAKNYFLGCTLGNLPLVMVYTAFGFLLKNIGKQPWVAAIPVGVILLFTFIASLITKRMIAANKAKQQ